MTPENLQPLYLRCMKTGEILFVAGDSIAYFENELIAGEQIENISPFNALVPLRKNRLLVPSIEIRQELWVDIILEASAEHLYILLIDCSAAARKIREKSQHKNLEILNKKKNRHGKT
ncbi:MAG: hypothetical protein U5Q03_03580 [Bacteroidota bacterium]|nr:hypothetical protein [Bacteroidota bacterium]